MADRRRTATPLGFAIAASLAVLPVLLGIVWLVAVARPADAGAALAERHSDPRRGAALRTVEAAIVERTASAGPPRARAVLDGIAACRGAWGERRDGGWRWPFGVAAAASAAGPVAAERVAAQLARFDATLHRFSSRANAAVERPVGLDGTRWLEAASAGVQSQAFGCDDLAAAVAGVARAGDAELLTWSWRGRTAPAARADWSATQQAAIDRGQTARGNPWAGVPGCIVFGGSGAAPHVLAAPGSVAARLCTGDARALADGATVVPAADTTRAAVATAKTASAPVVPASEGATSPPMARVVATTEPAVDESPASDRWGVPPSLETMLAPLANWRKPAGSGGRRATLDGVPIALGRPVALTIDPVLQALAQKTAACYTGRHDVCRALGIARTADAGRPPGTGLLEGAMVRMAAVAIVDVPSGRIEALAGARTPCARQEVDGPGRDPSCDTRLPWPVRFRPDALLNPAVFHDAMPASTIKPVLAAALLADGESGTRLLAAERAAAANERGGTPSRGGLRGELVRSDSARFLDRLFCADRAFAADCVRPWRVAEMATAFGWNAGCNAPSDGRGRGAGTGREAVPGDGPRDPGQAGACGRRDLLTGGTDVGEASGDRLPRRPVSFGRLMVEPRDGALRPFAPTRLDGGIVARCAAGADGRRGSNDDWEKCRGGRVVDVVAEGWGQGHARASALGVAGMMAALAAAADGRAAPAPHLVRAGPWSDAAAATTASPSVPPEAAATVLQALSWTHRTGTARSACAQVLGVARCATLEGLAGKTGTPSFPSDGLTLDAIAALCRDGAAERGMSRSDPDRAERRRRACGPLRPDKWYVAAWRTGGAADAPWSKAIAVLVERNWSQTTGLVQGVGDHGPNPAAEIALQITGRQLGWLPTPRRDAVHATATAAGAAPGALR